MSTFDSTKTQLSTLLQSVIDGKLQLPDFPRGWVGDDEHIRSLLTDAAMHNTLRSHRVDAALLRADSFEAFFAARRAALLGLVEQAMGKATTDVASPVSDDDEEGDADNQVGG